MPDTVVSGNSSIRPAPRQWSQPPVSVTRPREKQTDEIRALLDGRCPDPTGVLGPLAPASEPDGRASCIRVFVPGARRVEVSGEDRGGNLVWIELPRIHADGLFEGPVGEDAAGTGDYRLRIHAREGEAREVHDPYRFAPVIRPEDLDPFLQGAEARLDRLLGAALDTRDGVEGVRFAVWAPHAAAVNVMGSFNAWEGRRSPMRPIGDTGVWELFLPDVRPGALYKYEVRPAGGGADEVPSAIEKADPLGQRMEVRPRTASMVPWASGFEWSDDAWMEGRATSVAPDRPISVYEVHLGSWRRSDSGQWLGYRELAHTLLPYVRDLGFTHVEILPLTEHPLDRSWGYQTVGYFALTSRYGEPDDFRYFVNEAHRLGLGVLLDWAPAHFPMDAHGLWRFDGTPTYEHADPLRGAHPDWGTAVFDYGKPEVVSFLVSSARFWIEEYHVDGVRVDAVASMIYLDYSRGEGEWRPNEEGGRENLEAVEFLKRLTSTLHAAGPGVLLCAEESTAWPGVTAPIDEGGLGFDLKWNMGWMNDSLTVMGADPGDRSRLHERLTFSMHYAYSERYLLPISHDEVVHLKRSLASKMPGEEEDRLSDVRLFLAFMWTHPGAKLLFMGAEFGQWDEWDEAAGLTWDLLDRPAHAALNGWVRSLNETYRAMPALHALDTDPSGFQWLDVHDADRSVLAYVRRAPEPDDFIAVVLNFSDSAWEGYRLGVPSSGTYDVVLDSDDATFGGRGRTRVHGEAEDVAYLENPASLRMDLAPRSAVLLRRRPAG
jgi:1,4-alpha-glucan branching enzyme